MALSLGCAGQPSERSEPDAQQLNRACGSCHVDIAREWAGSEHHRSADGVFRAALSREPSSFCESCHAPERRHRELGVACVTCHAATAERAAVPAERLPALHPAVAVATGTTACKSCHEFEFPGPRVQRELFQATVTEHERTSFVGSGCSGCHMPEVRGHASHTFAASRTNAAHREAVRVVAERTGPTALRLSLSTRGVGHAYPTGDLFRRLALRVEARGPDFAVLARDERFLARHFTDVLTAPRTSERRVQRDDRLVPGETRVVDFELGPDAAGRELFYELRFERVLHMNPRFEAFAQVESSQLLASGILPALKGTSP